MGILNPGALSKNKKKTSSSSGSSFDKAAASRAAQSSKIRLTSKQIALLKSKGVDTGDKVADDRTYNSGYKPGEYDKAAASRAAKSSQTSLTTAQLNKLRNDGVDVSGIIASDAVEASASVNPIVADADTSDGSGSTATSVTADSSSAVASEDAIGADIAALTERAGLEGDVGDFIDPLTQLYQVQADQIEEERAALERRRQEEIQGINEGFDIQKTETETAQGREAGQTSMNIARAGGYLGVTSSQQGILQSLAITQRQEMVALEALRNDKIREANQAYEDRNFELSREALKSARELEAEIFDRRQAFLDQQLDLLSEERAQLQERRLSKESKWKIAGDRMDRMLDAGLTPSQDDLLAISMDTGIGIEELNDMFEAGARSLALAEKKDKTDMELAIVSQMRGTPRDRTFTIDGETYRGLAELSKTSSGSTGTATEREARRTESIKALFLDDLKGEVGGYDAEGKIDPEGRFTEDGREVAPPLTIDEAIKLYPELEQDYIEDTYRINRTYLADEEIAQQVEAGNWDIQYSPSQKESIIIDKASYKTALEAWEKESTTGTYAGQIQGDDDKVATVVLDGVSYTGIGQKIGDEYWSPVDPSAFEVDKFKKQREVSIIK